MTPLRLRQLEPVLLALACTEAGVRLLSPSEPIPRPVPVRAADYFSASEMARGARFARPQLALALLREAVQIGVLALLTFGSRVPGPGRRLRGRRRLRPGREAAAGALAAIRILGWLTLARLPLAAVARRRAIAVGLDTQSWPGWAADVARTSAIGSGLAGGAGAGVVALTRRYPRGWWVAAAGASVAGAALFGMLAPVLLDPLFNDFTPLPEGQVRSDVLELGRAAGVRVGEVLSVDASRRTTGANAYVTGLGPTKRVVLFDTLLDRYGREEIRVVVAHELSHVRHRDVLRALALMAIAAPATALSVQRLSRILPSRSGPQGLPALALASTLVTAPVGLVAARLSRAIERRADAESLELSQSPEGFISLQRALVRQNMADVDPPRWLALLASHPPPLERIGRAVAFGERRL